MECIVCKGKSFKKLLFIHEVSRYTKKAYSLFKCQKCGLIRPNPLPYKDENKNDIYDSADNIKFYNKETEKFDENSYEYKFYFNGFKAYPLIIDDYNISGKAIDIGCGAGHLMSLLTNKGINVEGMEISPLLVKAINKKFKVYCCEIGSKKIKRKNYNLATFNHVLEHVEDPQKFLVEVNKILINGGHLIFAVPYLHGLVPRILRTKWYGLGYGQHLNFFSKKSLEILLKNAGFKICEFRVLSVNYDHPKFPRVVNLFANFLSNLIVLIGFGDNLFTIAKKNREVGEQE